MTRRRKQARRFALTAGLMLIPALAVAADQGARPQAKGTGQQPPAAATQPSPMNVEQLNDKIAQHAGKVELEGTKNFLVADRITRQRD